MSDNYSVIYLDMDTGNKLYLEKALGSGIAQFKYIQNVPAATWTLFHQQFSDKFVISITDENNEEIVPDSIVVFDLDTIAIHFSEPVMGKAILIIFDKSNALPSPTPTTTASNTLTPTPSVSKSVSATPTPTPTNTRTISVTPSITASMHASATPSPTVTLTATPTPTLTVTPSASSAVILLDGHVADALINDSVAGSYMIVNGDVSGTFSISNDMGDDATFSINSGTFPAGLSLNSDGTFAGAYNTAGSFTWVVKAVDSEGRVGMLEDSNQVATIAGYINATAVLGAQVQSSNALTPRGLWAFVMGDFDFVNRLITLYVDDVNRGTAPAEVGPQTNIDITIGGINYSSEGISGWRGDIWGAGIANGGLTADERSLLWNSGNGIRFDDLSTRTDSVSQSLWAKMAYAWQLDDDATGDTYIDLTGHKNLSKSYTLTNRDDSKFGRVTNFPKSGKLTAINSSSDGFESNDHSTYFAWVFAEVEQTDDFPSVISRYNGGGNFQGIRCFWTSDVTDPTPTPSPSVTPSPVTPTPTPSISMSVSLTPLVTPTPTPSVSTGPIIPYESAILNRGPLVFLKLNETSGLIAKDSSGNGRDGTYNNTTIIGANGLYGSPYSARTNFAGFNIPWDAGLDVTGDFTIFMTAKISSASNSNQYPKLVSKYAGDASSGYATYMLQMTGSSGDMTSRVSTTDNSYNDITTSYPVNDDITRLYAVRRSGNEVSYFINDTLIGSITVSGNNSISNSPIQIGGDNNARDGMDANVQWFSVFDYAIADNDITSLYYLASGITPTPTPSVSPSSTPNLTSIDPYFNNVVSLLHLDGDNGSQTITDQISSNQWTARLAAGLSNEKTLVSGTCASLPGTAYSYLSTPYNPIYDFGTGDFTIEITVMFRAFNGEYQIFASRQCDSPVSIAVQLRLNPSNIIETTLRSGDGSQVLNVAGTSVLSENTKYSIGVRRLNGIVELYVNNIMEGTIACAYDMYDAAQTHGWVLGTGDGNDPGSGNNLNGWLDEFRVTKGVARDLTIPQVGPFPDVSGTTPMPTPSVTPSPSVGQRTYFDPNNSSPSITTTSSNSYRVATRSTDPDNYVSIKSYGHSTGKYYLEIVTNTVGSWDGGILAGFGFSNALNNTYAGADASTSISLQSNTSGDNANGYGFKNCTNSSVDRIDGVNRYFRLAIDFDAGKLWIGSETIWACGGSDPSIGSSPFGNFTPNTMMYVMASMYDSGNSVTMNAYSDEMIGAIPTGFLPWGGS